MNLLAVYKDDFYPFSYINHNRLVSRAIIINDNNEILLEKIKRNDMFGNETYFETPGGGVNPNENLKEAVIREVKEECGLIVEVLDEIGIVEDDYNLIHRHNITHYFLCKITGKCSLNREEYETQWIKDIQFISLEDVLELTSNPKSKIANIVYRRERTIFQKINERV